MLDRLKRKYSAGGAAPLDQVIAFGEQVGERLAEIENRDAMLGKTSQAGLRQPRQFRAAAEKLTAGRSAAARKLEKRRRSTSISWR